MLHGSDQNHVVAFLYGFLYLYTFVVSNQITGVSEDKINKPDRPIASGAESLRAAKIRYWVLTAMYLALGHALGVSEWALLWIVTTIAHNPLGFSNFGPTKDLCMGLGCIAQLKAAWAIGGSPPDMGWEWIKVITLYMLWPIPLQDLRDVPGDLAAGRRTTPILLGDLPGTYLTLNTSVSCRTNISSASLHLGWYYRFTGRPMQVILGRAALT